MSPLSEVQKRQLLELVAEGMTNTEIARHIRLQVDRGRPGWMSWNASITDLAVNRQVSLLLAELGVTATRKNARTKAVHAAYRKGILLSEEVERALGDVVAAILEHEAGALEWRTDPDPIAVEVRAAIGSKLFDRLATQRAGSHTPSADEGSTRR